MTVRIKEIVIRYEDDGEVSPLSAEEHKEKYRPLNLVVHHHCAPPPGQVGGDTDPKRIEIDLNKAT